MSVTIFPQPAQEPWHFSYVEDDRVVIEGRLIPKLRARDEGENVAIIVDGRLSISVPKERGVDVAWLVAHALAIGAGYSSLHAETKDQPFAPLCAHIGAGEQP